MTPHDRDRLKRDLLTLPRGGKEWRKKYSAYRRTEHWLNTRAYQLSLSPFCAMHRLMSDNKTVPATEVHHTDYSAWFDEHYNGHIVSVCRACHQLWTNRFGRKKS